jgi:hypothetical protein
LSSERQTAVPRRLADVDAALDELGEVLGVSAWIAGATKHAEDRLGAGHNQRQRQHDDLDPRALVGGSFADVADTGFTDRGASPGRESALTGLGVTYSPAEARTLAVYVSYDGAFAANETDNAITAASNTVGRRALRAAVHSMTR